MSQLKRRRRGFARFYRQHRERLLRALCLRARHLAWGDEALAEDLVQEGLVALWEVADQLHGYRHPLRVALHFGTRRMRRYIATHELRVEREVGREVERQRQRLEARASRRRVR